MRQFTDSCLVIATHNVGKMEEFQHLFSDFQISIMSAKELNLPEPKETAATFVGNARIKAHAAAKASGMPAISDDSGIEVDHLLGAPGVYTADWAETDKGRDFMLAMAKVWNKLKETNKAEPHLACFCCTIVIAWPDGHDEVFQGKIHGKIIWPIRGKNGHGFDPMFQPEGYTSTFGEMDRWKKNKLSHRNIAFKNLILNCFS